MAGLARAAMGVDDVHRTLQPKGMGAALAVLRGVDVLPCNQRWVSAHQQPLVFTSLPILRPAVPFGLASCGLVVIGAFV